MKTVIFTDLDGTLLAAGDYSFSQAAQALGRIKRERIPLVLSSTKTKREIEEVRKLLGNNDPFISENGGGIFISAGYFPFDTGGVALDGYREIILGKPYNEVRNALSWAASKVNAQIRGFGDMTENEVAALTGLTAEGARLAKERDFDEPFLFTGAKEDEEQLKSILSSRGFSCTPGRFFHISWGGHDKGVAVKKLKEFYTALFGEITTVGLGDSLIDLPILKEVDYPVLVRKPSGVFEDLGLSGIIKADGVGPAGWNRALIGILDTIEASGRGTC